MYNTSQIQIETCRLSDYLDTINMEYLISIWLGVIIDDIVGYFWESLCFLYKL